MTDDLLSAFDACLSDLQDGVGLEEALSRYPAALAAELRPLLEAAQFAQLSADVQPRPEAELASRGKFLALGREVKRQQRTGLFGWLFGPAPAAIKRRTFALQAASLVFVAGTLLGVGATVNAAGTALPGDLLYGLKLTIEDAQLALAPEPASQQDLQDQFDARRVEEVQQLLAERRESAVDFVGDIQVQDAERWVVSGIPVQVTGSLGQGFGIGQRVRVIGQTSAILDAVAAERIDRLALPTLVPTLAPVTETSQPTATPTVTVTREATRTVEPSETPSPTQSPIPPTVTLTVMPGDVLLPTTTTAPNLPAPSQTPHQESGGEATHTPEPATTDDDHEDDDHHGSSPSNTPKPTDDHSGSDDDDDHDEPTRTPKP